MSHLLGTVGLVRYRLYPTPAQEIVLAEHCSHARYMWNLALEQTNCYRPAWGPTPRYNVQAVQLTEARAAAPWLAAGSVTVQQQALRDFDQAMRNWWSGTHRRPTWRRRGVHEGFRQVGLRPEHVERLNKHWARVWVPKCGWVRFRWSRQAPLTKSYRVTYDRAGRWHVAFAVKPELITGPGDGSVLGIDRGVVASLACSDGTIYSCPRPGNDSRARRQLARTHHGSNRRRQARTRVATRTAREAARRRDWAEKASTDLARRFDVIRIENLNVRAMTASAKGTVDAPGRNVRAKTALNRSILASGWGLFARRLGDKIGHRLELVPPAYTSQRCSCCGWVDARSRESQAQFVCTRCGYSDNADVNAARNIARGHRVTARGGLGVVDLPVKREPQLFASSA